MKVNSNPPAVNMEESEVKEKAIQCYIEMFKALTTKNPTSLAEILDNDFTLIHVNGTRSNKEEYVGNISDGSLIFYSAKHEYINVNIKASPITVTGKSQTDVATANGERKIWRLQQELDIHIKDGKWLIKQARASVYL